MNFEDSEVFGMLEQKVRNPYPNKIVWKQCGDVPKRDFYWLSVSEENCKPHALVEAFKKDNLIEIVSEDLSQIQINLNEFFFDFEQKLKVSFNGNLVFHNFLQKDIQLVKETFEKHCDPYLYFCSKVIVTSNEKIFTPSSNNKHNDSLESSYCNII